MKFKKEVHGKEGEFHSPSKDPPFFPSLPSFARPYGLKHKRRGLEARGEDVERRGMAISKKIRFEVFKRDGFQCRYCGKQPPEVILEIDHIVPKNKNGGDEFENLITACFDCNRGKGEKGLTILPQSCDDRVERIKEQEEQIRVLYREQAKRRRRIEKDIELIDNKVLALENGKYCLSEEGRLSVKQLLRNFTRSEIEEALEIAFQHPNIKDHFSYACGVLWTKKKQKET